MRMKRYIIQQQGKTEFDFDDFYRRQTETRSRSQRRVTAIHLDKLPVQPPSIEEMLA